MPVIVTAVAIAIVIAVPVAFCLPAMFATVPPLVVAVPAAFPLGSQLVPALFGFMTALSMSLDRAVQPALSLLNSPLAMFAFVIGVYAR
ncbi:MAG TPA: hypothetical protein VFO39_07975 [Candidatus Sulfotelmatobacter sp.]|nr:hypothetical protein [Candidatus Sulfotelmatobacter sp.]